MTQRLLIACLVALLVMTGLSLLAQLAAPQLNRETLTPLGALPLGEAASVLVAMAAGGAVARERRFVGIALVLQAVTWLALVLVLAVRPASGAFTQVPLLQLLRYNGLAFVAGLLAAGAGAWLGVTLAQRRARQ